jgi:K+-sensing histidine kinase KdpD
MRKIGKKINTLFNAVTFAEAGEHEIAKEFLEEPSNPLTSPQGDLASASSAKRTRGRGLRESIQRYAAAAAFGESGEPGTAVEISHIPRNAAKVLLAIDGYDLDTDALRFAANLCTRMDASLDVLQVIHHVPRDTEESPESPAATHSEEIRKHIRRARAMGISLHISVSVGDVDEEVYAYAKSHKEVVAVVFDSPHARNEKLERGKWTRILQRLSRRLSIPMITAESKEPVGAL